MDRTDSVDDAAPVRRRSRTEVALLAVIAVAGGGLLGALVVGASSGQGDEAFPPPPPPAPAPPPSTPFDDAGDSLPVRWTGWSVQVASIQYEFLSSYPDVNLCAVIDGGRLRCVGDPQWPGLDGVPSDAMRDVSVDTDGACGVTVDGELVCWGTYELRVRPVVAYDTIVAFSSYDLCVLDVAGRVVCHSLHLQNDPDWAERRPDHPVLFQADGSRDGSVICGVTARGEPTCFGRFFDDAGRALLPPPDLRLRSVHVGQEAVCGIDLEGEIVCWGARNAVLRELPQGPFVDLTLNSWRICGLRADGTVACTRQRGPDRAPPDDLRFRTIALATGIQNLLCGVTLDAAFACWVPAEEGPVSSEIFSELRRVLATW